MGQEGELTVAVHLGGLDGTMERSVGAFLEARHGARFALSDQAGADLVLVDLDQPHAEAVLAAVGSRQVVVGIGFDAEPRRDGCRRYVQKPLSGGVLVNALAEAVALVGTQPAVLRPVRLDRPSHARDVFTKGRAWEPPPSRAVPTRPSSLRPAPTTTSTPTSATARANTAPPVARLHRAVHDRPLRLVDVAAPGSSSGSAAEVLEHRLEVEPVEARSTGDLRDASVLATYRYHPADHLDGLVRRVADRHVGTNWELHSPLLDLAADPTDGTVLISGSDIRLHGVCAAPVGDEWEVRTNRRPPDATHRHRVPLEELRWNLAVWCSRGRLPDTVDPFSPVAVAAWPNLTRCVLTPSAMPVIALLAGGPRCPADVAEVLGIPRTHVFVVLAALDALGLLEQHRAATTAPASAPATERGVLRRLLGRLRVA